MADRPGPSLRVAVVLALAVVGLLETLALVQGFRSHRRLTTSAAAAVRARVEAAVPVLRELIAPGGSAVWDAAARSALDGGLASEVEIFDESGRAYLSLPAPSPVGHWPVPAELERARRDGLLVVVRQSGAAARVLAYVPVVSGPDRLVVRLSARAKDLEEDFRERQQALIGHGVSVAFLVLAAALALLPARREAEPPPPRVLDAYEEAMGRLKEQGQAMSLRHQLERRHLEEVIRDRAAMARAGELTAGVVHEVRNGLGTIVGYARLMESAAPSSDAGDAARGILAECETLERVARRFMEFVKDEKVQLAPLDLGRMLSRVVARELRNRTVRPRLSGLEEAGVLRGDEGLLERAFENLVRNAAEAAGERGQVFVDVDREEGAVVVRVGDDGPGMSDEQRASLRPFATTKPGGLGLGLPIALKIVRLHGGDLVLTPRAPRGLAVTTRLPLDGPPDEPDSPATLGNVGGPSEA
jgi:signal transduction histidine kinase